MNIFKKLFGSKTKEEKIDQNKTTSFKSTTMSASDLANLKVGDTISFGNPDIEKKDYKAFWIPANESPYNIEVFDCREYALNMTSTTQNPEIAKKFLHLRENDGQEYIGKFPEKAAKCEVDLSFQTKGKQIPDGIVFKAQKMEEKWDIYKYADFLFFVRSWTGELIYFTNYIPTEKGFNVKLVVLDESKIAQADPFFEFKVVEFLIHSHILGYNIPHPIPKIVDRDKPESILAYSFSMFGNKGQFGTYE